MSLTFPVLLLALAMSACTAEPSPATSPILADPRTATVGQPITFDAARLAGPDVLAYLWRFDALDTQRVTAGPTTVYAFAAPGLQTVLVSAALASGAARYGAVRVAIVSNGGVE